MKIGYMILYKTPLDSNYKNVFDNYDNALNYVEKLTSCYSHKIIEPVDCAKVVVNNNNGFSAIVNYTWEEIKDYNYCAVLTDTKYIFSFITDITNINDNDSSKSCKIYCDYDAWSNNYLNIKSNYAKNFIEKRHYYTFHDIVGSTGKYQTLSVDKKMPVHTYRDTNHELNYMVWMRIRMSESTYVEYYDTSTGTWIGRIQGSTGAIRMQPSGAVYFIPFCICDNDGNVINPAFFGLGYFSCVYGTGWLDDIQLNGLDFIRNNPYILEATLTTHAPFKYAVHEPDKKVYVTPTYSDDESQHYLNPLRVYDMKDSGAGSYFCAYQLDDNPTHIANYVEEDFYNSRIISLSENIPTISDDFSTEKNYDLESALNIYPFKYNSFSIGRNVKIDLIPKSNTSIFTITLNEYPSTSIVFKAERNTETEEWQITQFPSRMTISKNSQAEYLTTNSYSISAAKTSNTISSVWKIAQPQPSIAGFAQNIGGASIDYLNKDMSINAKIKDSDNAIDSVSIPPYIVSDDFKILDRLIIYKNVMDDPRCVEEIYNLCHNYGVDFNMIGNIFDNYHYIFDYVKTINCEIMSSISDIDKQKIQQAFNNGITKWHLSSIDLYGITQTDIDNFSNFNKSLLNASTEIARG